MQAILRAEQAGDPRRHEEMTMELYETFNPQIYGTVFYFGSYMALFAYMCWGIFRKSSH